MKILIVGLGSMGKCRARLAKGMRSDIVICGVDPLNTEAEEMTRRLIDAGVEVLVKKFPRASHGFLEHWFFKEYYMDALSPEERAGLPENIGDQAEEGLAFVIGAAKHFLSE